MRTLKTLRPGRKGTRELVARYGTSLLCVRYRFDDLTRERVKTVELIIQRRSTEPHLARPQVRRAAPTADRTEASRAPVVVRTARGRAPLLRPLGGAEGRSPHPPGRDRSAPADQIRRWSVGPAPPPLASPPRPRRTPRSPSPGGGGSRWVDVDTGGWMWTPGGEAAMDTRVDRYGCEWADMGTACR